jgi:hypothetical protein
LEAVVTRLAIASASYREAISSNVGLLRGGDPGFDHHRPLHEDSRETYEYSVQPGAFRNTVVFWRVSCATTFWD